MLSASEYFQELFRKADFKDKRKEFAEVLPKLTASANSLSEFYFLAENVSRESFGVFQALWDVAALDNVPMTMYEREECRAPRWRISATSSSCT